MTECREAYYFQSDLHGRVLMFQFLGAFAKLRKAIITFITFLRLSTAPSGQIFMKFDIWVFFENLSIKFKFH